MSGLLEQGEAADLIPKMGRALLRAGTTEAVI